MGKKEYRNIFSQITWSRGIQIFHKSIPLTWNLHVTHTMEHFTADLFFSLELQKRASALKGDTERRYSERILKRRSKQVKELMLGTSFSIGWNFELDGTDYFPYYVCCTLELANSHTFLPLNLAWMWSVRSVFLTSCDDGLYYSKICLSLLGIYQMSAINHYCDTNLPMTGLTT